MAADLRPLILPTEADAELRLRELGLHGVSKSESSRLLRRPYKIYDLSAHEREALSAAALALGCEFIFSNTGSDALIIAADSQLPAFSALLAAIPELGNQFSGYAARLAPSTWVDASGRRLLRASGTTIMGVLNVTPDSFSDGGRFFDPILAEEQAERMLEEGADIIDVGGLSTRPGAAEIDAAEEMARVLPVIGRLARKIKAPISIDTYRHSVAEKAMDTGATVVNDISGFTFDERMAGTCARKNAAVVLMHTPAKPAEMMAHTDYRDMLRQVRSSLEASAARATTAGIASERIALDPGFGFGKTADQGWEMLRRLGEFTGLGRPLLVGVSRKSFFKELAPGATPEERDGMSATAAAFAVLAGARIVRTHNVKATREALLVADQLNRSPRL